VRPALAEVCAQVEREEGAAALLVTSGLGIGVREAHAEAAARLGATELAAPAGVSAARNVALAAAAESEVIVYIDDDVIPRPGWLAALGAQWRRAPADVACIGGAILPRWAVTPPAWVSPRIDAAFSLLDLGPDTLEVEPRTGREVWTANVSFRVEVLRATGGFDPNVGPWGGVHLFGEDSVLLRRLAAGGRRILYAGDARVEHVIGAERLRLRGLWRREFYRGASATQLGDTSAGAEVPRAAKAAAGLVLAAARRDQPLAGERFARLARSAGGSAAPLLLRWLRRRGWPG
jgi:GT2 family glycosyltransferase